ncbi:MAG TPA: DUF998 domain-containing protein [Chitinophagaceae bacterium]|nr:DUF998 domain-containing protein [Chitinophagaceae bacterium]
MEITTKIVAQKKVQPQQKLQVQKKAIKLLLICGILSSLLYIAMNIFIPTLYQGYNSVTQTVSELSAIGAPTRPLWVPLGILYTLFVAAFGVGIRQSAGQSRSLRILGSLMIVCGLIGLAWTPMHQREVTAAGGGSFTDTWHIIMSMITVLLMMLMMGFGAASFGKGFRLYCIVSIVLFVVFGALTGLEAPGISTNQPTPMIGVWERINIGIFMIWTIVLAVILLRRKIIQPRINNRPAEEIRQHIKVRQVI